MKNTKVNCKQLVTKVLNKINEGQFSWMRTDFDGMMRGEYDASAHLADKLVGFVLVEAGPYVPNQITCNLINNPITGRVDTIRRYCHEWRKIEQLKKERQAAQTVTVPQIVTES
jgi:hypothetical protein